MAVTADDLDGSMTKRELAARLRISIRSVDRMIKEGKIETVHLGAGRGTVRITQRALTEYLTRNTRKADREPTTGRRRAS